MLLSVLGMAANLLLFGLPAHAGGQIPFLFAVLPASPTSNFGLFDFNDINLPTMASGNSNTVTLVVTSSPGTLYFECTFAGGLPASVSTSVNGGGNNSICVRGGALTGTLSLNNGDTLRLRASSLNGNSGTVQIRNVDASGFLHDTWNWLLGGI